MESNAAEELAALNELRSTTRLEVVRTPWWYGPVIVASMVLFVAAYSLDVAWFEKVGWLLWVVYVWGLVILSRRHNRAKAPRSELWNAAALMAALLGLSFLLAAVFNPLVGGVVGGLGGATAGAVSVWRERRR